MNNQDDFDARLAACFEREHLHAPADGFVADTMRKIRAGRRRQEVVRITLRIAALVVLVATSPWLIAGVEWLNTEVKSSVASTSGFPGAWVLGALAALVVLGTRLRRR